MKRLSQFELERLAAGKDIKELNTSCIGCHLSTQCRDCCKECKDRCDSYDKCRLQ